MKRLMRWLSGWRRKSAAGNETLADRLRRMAETGTLTVVPFDSAGGLSRGGAAGARTPEARPMTGEEAALLERVLERAYRSAKNTSKK